MGLAVGLAGAIVVAQASRALLYGVRPGDPFTLAAVAAILMLVSAVACWLPARRASKIDVMRALRTE